MKKCMFEILAVSFSLWGLPAIFIAVFTACGCTVQQQDTVEAEPAPPPLNTTRTYYCPSPLAITKGEKFTIFSGPDGRSIWRTPSTIKYSVSANTPPFASASLLAALNTWNSQIGNVFAFQAVPAAGDLQVAWDDTGAQIPNPLYLAWTTQRLTNVYVTSATITVNAHKYTYHSGAPRGVQANAPNPDGTYNCDIDGVLLHECGHVFGLNHSDLDPAAIQGNDGTPTMNSVIYPGAENLHIDDIAGIRNLYSAASSDHDLMINLFMRMNVGFYEKAITAPKTPKDVVGLKFVFVDVLPAHQMYFGPDGMYLGEIVSGKWKKR